MDSTVGKEIIIFEKEKLTRNTFAKVSSSTSPTENFQEKNHTVYSSRVEQILVLKGKYAFVPTSSEEFARRKHEEI